MSLTTWLGRGPELLADAAPTTRRLRLPTPILTAEDLDRVCSSPLPWAPIDATWPISLGEAGLEAAVERLVAAAVKAVSGGAEILVIGDRHVGPKRAPVPALLATAAVHHELVRAGLRTRDVARDRLGRAARGASLRVPGGLRRRRRARLARGRRDRPRARAGAAEDDVEDGRLDRLGLPRRAGVRGDRARAGAGGPLLHGHAVEGRRDRAARARARGADAPRALLSAGRRDLPLAPRRRAALAGTPTRSRRCSAASGGRTSRPPTRRRATAPCAGSSRSARRTASTSTTSSRSRRS